MEGKSRWVTREMKCPEASETCSVLLEWQTHKGKRLLRSLTCFNPQLADYHGKDCQWLCLERLSEPNRPRG